MTGRWFLAVLLCLACGRLVSADPPDPTPHRFWHSGWLWTRACPSVGCCPDDYCRKPFPSIVPIACHGGPDDYCRKPLPTVPLVHCGGPDDYCRKPMPTLLCPPQSPYLQCGPSDGGCSGCSRTFAGKAR